MYIYGYLNMYDALAIHVYTHTYIYTYIGIECLMATYIFLHICIYVYIYKIWYLIQKLCLRVDT